MNETTTEHIIKELPIGLLYWYDFAKNSTILYIGDDENHISKYLERISNSCDCASDISNLQHGKLYNYIIAIGVLERAKAPVETLSAWQKLLSPDGKLLLGATNRLGLQYFCGEKDPFTERSFDGIENYRRATDNIAHGRAYSKAELSRFLTESGFHYQFYSVLPNLTLPQLIYREDYLPKEELSGRYFPKYTSPHTIFLEEEHLYSDMIENGLFHTLANTFLIECTKTGALSDIMHATLSMDRGKEKAIATIVHDNQTVEKRMLYDEGRSRLKALAENTIELQNKGLPMVVGQQNGLSYTMPYIEGESLVKYLRKLFFVDIDQFIQKLDAFRDLILQSSSIVATDETLGIILEKGYIDLIPLNALWTEEKIMLFDQEVYLDDLPLGAILFRAVSCVYLFDASMEKKLPISFFWKRYDIENQLEEFQQYDIEFIKELRNQTELSPFYRKYERDANMVHSNRQKLNYSAVEYQRIFIDLFRDIEQKELILFGSGQFAERFLAFYGKQYPVSYIVDNKESAWGTTLSDVPILSPDTLTTLSHTAYRVIICVKNYGGIVRQLEAMGIKNYCVYDPNVSYQTNEKSKAIKSDVSENSTKDEPKKYQKGYIAGVFDLFHIGHLNLLRRAKEQCEYLIVGVVTDEGVQKYKKTETVIGFAERLEIVGACKYVDEAVEIPLSYGGSADAYTKYRFDCQFSGSDYTSDPNWLSEKEFLEAQGAELVFFPYTEGTSSTKLKAFLNDK